MLFIPKIANIADDFGVILMVGFKKLLVTVCATILPLVGWAQFDSQRTQYMHSVSAYNAGAIAQNDMCNVLGTYRLQWAGFSNAPTDIVVSGDIPLNISGTKHGLGVTFQNDKVGLFENQAFSLKYAYQMRLWRGTLGLGLDLGFLNQAFNFDDCVTGGSEFSNDSHKDKGSDPMLQGVSSDQNDMAFNVGFGAYYSDDEMYVGLSVLNLNKPSFEFGESEETNIPRIFYLTGGYDMALSNEDYHLKPSALFRTDFSTSQFDLDCLVDYKKKFMGGLGYRWGDSFDFLIGCNLLNGLFLGYAYDLPISKMIKSGGSHEVCLKYSFKLELAKKNKYKSERIL